MPSGSEALRFAVIVVASVTALALSSGFAPLIAPIPIAISVARGARETPALLLAVALAAGIIGPGVVIAAGLGALAGWGIRLGLTFTRIIFAVTLTVFSANAVLVALQWDQTVEEIEQTSEMLAKQIEEADTAEPSDQELANMQARFWLLDNWRETLPGISYTGMVMATCLIVSAVGKWRRLRDNVSIRAAFIQYRPSDGLVWLVIVAAVLWFIDYQWQIYALRVISWNMAFALAGIYWVNGLAVFVYGVAAWKPNVLVTIALVLVLMYGLMPMLAMIGLFDTWGEFRPRIDALIAARDARKNSYDDLA